MLHVKVRKHFTPFAACACVTVRDPLICIHAMRWWICFFFFARSRANSFNCVGLHWQHSRYAKRICAASTHTHTDAQEKKNKDIDSNKARDDEMIRLRCFAYHQIANYMSHKWCSIPDRIRFFVKHKQNQKCVCIVLQ